MEIQNIYELCDEIADWCGVYGACKAAENGEDCIDENPMCCRVGFTMVLREKILKAVEFEEMIKIDVDTTPIIQDWNEAECREQYLGEIVQYKHD